MEETKKELITVGDLPLIAPRKNNEVDYEKLWKLTMTIANAKHKEERSKLLEEIEKRPINKIYKKAMIENYSNGKKSAMYYMKGYDDATEDIVAVIRLEEMREE